MAPTLRLWGSDYRSAMQLRLGLLADAIGRICGCNHVLRPTGASRTLLCKLLSGATTLRHGTLVGFRCRAAVRAGLASSREAMLSRCSAMRAHTASGHRGDAPFVMPDGALVGDLAVVRPVAESYFQGAARAAGSAAAVRGACKVAPAATSS